MSHKLSFEEIGEVKKWIKQKGYIYLDLQYEILDHVVSAIEAKRQDNPKISLEKAFAEVHRAFGIFGFSEIEESFQSALRAKFWKKFMKSILQQFSHPYFLLVHVIVISLLTGLYAMLHEDSYIWISAIFILFPIMVLIMFHRQQKKLKHLQQFLTYSYINRTYILLACPSTANFFFRLNESPKISADYGYIIILAVSFLFTSLLLANKIVSKYFIQETEKMYLTYGRL